MRKWLAKLYRSKESISKEEMYSLIQNNDNVILVDVRSPQEFEEKHLDQAINIPTYEIYQKAKTVIKNADTIIICYCTLGIRSKKALQMLKKLGYKNVFHLYEGM